MTENSNVTHTIIEDNIHHIKLHQSSRQTIEDLFDLITELSSNAKEDELLLYLFDNGDAPEMPYRYMIQRADKWHKETATLPPSRNAIIYNKNAVMLHVVNMVMKMFNKEEAEARLFRSDQLDDAISWLRSFRTTQ